MAAQKNNFIDRGIDVCSRRTRRSFFSSADLFSIVICSSALLLVHWSRGFWSWVFSLCLTSFMLTTSFYVSFGNHLLRIDLNTCKEPWFVQFSLCLCETPILAHSVLWPLQHQRVNRHLRAWAREEWICCVLVHVSLLGPRSFIKGLVSLKYLISLKINTLNFSLKTLCSLSYMSISKVCLGQSSLWLLWL